MEHLRSYWDALLTMDKFRLQDSDKWYAVRHVEPGKWALYELGSNCEVGEVIRTVYSFIVITRVHGLMMRKEIDFKDVKIGNL